MKYHFLIVTRPPLRRVRDGCEAVFVGGEDTDRAVIGVLLVPEVGVIGPGHASHARAGTDEAGANVNGVGIARLHVDSWERWEWAWSGLVVPRRVGTRAAAWVEAGEEERAATFVLEVGAVQFGLGGEEELKRAVCVGPRRGHLEAEDRADIIGCEDTKVLSSEFLVWFRLGDLGNVVRVFELAGFEGSRASFARRKSAFAQDFTGVGGGKASQESDNRGGLHLSRCQSSQTDAQFKLVIGRQVRKKHKVKGATRRLERVTVTSDGW